MKIHTLIQSAVLCSALVFAQALAPAYAEQNTANEEASASKRCLVVGSIADWRAIDRKRLIIWAPSKQHPFLVELSSTCQALYNGETLSIQSRDNRLCDFGGDSLWIDGERCLGGIQVVRPLAADAIDELFEAD